MHGEATRFLSGPKIRRSGCRVITTVSSFGVITTEMKKTPVQSSISKTQISLAMFGSILCTFTRMRAICIICTIFVLFM